METITGSNAPRRDRHTAVDGPRRCRRVVSGVAILAVVIGASVGACSDTQHGDTSVNHDRSATTDTTAADETGASGGQDAGKEREKTRAVYALMRTLDPCALLDPTAAEHAANATPEDVVPGDGELSRCSLGTVVDGHTPSYLFTVDVGVRSPEELRQGTQRETIGGVEFWLENTPSGCDATHIINDDLDDDLGVQLSVVAPIFEDDTEASCEIAKSYLATTAKQFASPPVRDQSTTGPRLPLAAQDPCAAVSAVLNALGTHGDARPLSPYTCGVFASAATTNPDTLDTMSIAYKFSSDPREDVADDSAGAGLPAETFGTMTAVTVDGHPGSMLDLPKDQPCGVDVVLDESVSAQTDHTTRYQVVSVLAADCDTAQTVTKAVLDHLDA